MKRTGSIPFLVFGALFLWAASASAFLGIDLGGGDDDKPRLSAFQNPDRTAYDELFQNRATSLAIARSEGYGLLPDSPLTEYVNSVLARIVARSPVPDLPVRAFIRADGSFGALATPDGMIIIDLGMLFRLESEDELAAILAHELSHVLYRHHATDWFAKSQQTAAQAVDLFDQLKSAAKNEQHQYSETGLLLSLAAEVSDRVIASNLWNKDQEEEADRLGFDMALAAGYSPIGPIKGLRHLAEWYGLLLEKEEKQAVARRKAREQQLEAAGEKGDAGGILGGVVTNVIGAVGDAADATMDAIGGDHRTPKERIARLRDYYKKHHRKAPRPDLVPLPWQRKEPKTAAIIDSYKLAMEASAALAELKLKTAEKLIRKSISGPTKSDPFLRVTFFQLRNKQKRDRKADLNLAIAMKGEEPAFIVYRLMIRRLIKRNRMKEAVSLLQEASTRLGDPPHLLPYRIAVLVDARKKADSLALVSRCKLEHPAFAPACERALAGSQSLTAEKDEYRGRGRTVDQIMQHKADEKIQTAR